MKIEATATLEEVAIGHVSCLIPWNSAVNLRGGRRSNGPYLETGIAF